MMVDINNEKMNIPVVILAGGLGTRLRSVVPNKPKILAPIGNVSFLSVLLNWLESEGVEDVIFSLGFEAQQVVNALNILKEKHHLSIRYAIEPEPLGTLGGLSYTLKAFSINECLVMNGDTFVEVKLNNFVEWQRSISSFSGLVSKFVNDTSRYGQLAFKNNIFLASFKEKNKRKAVSGWINAGIYYISSLASKSLKTHMSGSVETDFLSARIDELTYFKVHQGRFIDIGTPESYQQAPFVLQEYIR